MAGGDRKCQKRPTYGKRDFLYGKRGLYILKKRPIDESAIDSFQSWYIMAKEAYIFLPYSYMAKEAYRHCIPEVRTCVQRDLL